MLAARVDPGRRGRRCSPAYPHLRGRVPHLRLGRFPTPVQRVEGLTPAGVELWVKHDDQSGLAYGGNKVRKLEFLLAEARARGARRLVTLGAIGSHHVLATAIYGRQAGLEVEAVVFPQPLTDHVREQLLADVASGAHLRPTSGYLGVPLAVLRARRPEGTMWIAPGGSSVTGSLGYVSAGLELKEQIARGELPRPDVIYVALGSCGTAAGLLCGLRRPGRRTSPASWMARCAWSTAWRRTRGACARWSPASSSSCASPGAPLPLPRWRVEHLFFGGAYGRATPDADEAVHRAGEVGLRLEPTYTGKTMAALLADAGAGRLDGNACSSGTPTAASTWSRCWPVGPDRRRCRRASSATLKLVKPIRRSAEARRSGR